MTIEQIYEGAENLINQIIAKEMFAQGHHLSGAMAESLNGIHKKRGKADLLEGFAAYYTQFVNDGVPASSASFKQFPFMVRYFQQRGLQEDEAKRAAAATIRVWMKEGMSTSASKRFSSTGSRQQMIENAFTGAAAEIDGYMGNGLDFMVEEQFQKEKSETI